jgi:hypothetical protein
MMAFIAGSLVGREHRSVSLSSAPIMIIVVDDYFYMGSPADHNQSRATEIQKEIEDH